MPPTDPPSPPRTWRRPGLMDLRLEGRVPLFVYGSLRYPEVLKSLIGRVPDGMSTAVSGWRAARLEGRVYPALVPAADHQIANGLVFEDLTPDEWRLIDDFEDEVYALRWLEPRGTCALAYVCDGGTDVLAEDWDFEAFGENDLRAYVERCADWAHRYRSAASANTDVTLP